MASISCDKGGLKRLLFFDGDGKRRTIRLGRMDKKRAEKIATRVDGINAARITGTPLDASDARWLATLPDDLHARLARAGLTEGREHRRAALGVLLNEIIADLGVKASTETTYRQTRRSLIDHFGEATPAGDITPIKAAAWRQAMRDAGLADATISKRIKTARQFFRHAMKWGVVHENPMASLKAGAQTNRERMRFVTPEEVARVLDAAPDAEWRVLITLSRYCGLRVPSEALALRWQDIDWAKGRIRVHASKTAHHKDGGVREVPIFPEVKEHLLALFEQAEEGAEQVITRYRAGSNLNTQLRRIITRAGLTPWPRTWHNMRASRQTELTAAYPLHTVCAWLGNTAGVAMAHYLTVSEGDWTQATGGAECGAQAAQKASQQGAAGSRIEVKHKREKAVKQGNSAPSCASSHDAARAQNDPYGIRTRVFTVKG